MRPLDPAPVSVLNEPYENALKQYNRELYLTTTPRWRRCLHWLNRALTCCVPRKSLAEYPSWFKPVKELPPNIYVGPNGELIQKDSDVYDVKNKDRPPYRVM